MFSRHALLTLIVLLTACSSTVFAAENAPGSLSAEEEAWRTVELMGGVTRVRAAAAEALEKGGEEDIAWARVLADYLLLIDDQDSLANSIVHPDSETSNDLPAESQPDYADQVAQSGADDWLFPAADSWNFDQNYVSVSVAEADWTIDEVFPGTKVIAEGRYSFYRGMADPVETDDCECEPLPTPRKTMGTIKAHLQWGEGETGLEYGRLSATYLGYVRTYDRVRGEFSRLRDTLRWGEIQIGKDDPLGIEDYYEFTLVDGSRTWQWQPKKSDFLFTVGLNGFFGYAWATSTNEIYADVSNPIIGSALKMSVNREGWGGLFVEQRVVNGFTLSSPSAGDSTSREARFRAGYINDLPGCLSFELYVEKRSFNFSDHRLDDLYTKSRRTGALLGCEF